ncbi:hypothetical protein Y032_0031g2390 [Ancylostoma ceylanicum]|uniref:Aspartate dehydrogenase domain-containing protein n=1 Tax=Ancylostoma ceylanicum TaxID=53326 RepID=A0A016UQ32_9BILA|nr:hypothetical protein Y032_0031g2390 [Ancylostoma ceylanicum]
MKRVGVIGYGHLGQFLVTELNRLDNFEVVRIWNRTADEANDILPLEQIVEETLSDIDLVVEVAHPVIIRQYADVILDSCDLFIGSPTCLADSALLDSIRSIALKKARRVLVPAGAFWGGNDIQKMADQGTLKALTITMTKHPSSFKLESPLKELNEAAKQETDKATVLYEGPVRSLCPLAPNNVNTMAGGAIAAHNLGFDGVTARLVSDPKMIDWHVVEVEAVGPDGFSVTTIRKNPAKPGAVTGQLTYYSFLASIKESIYKPVGVHIC